MMVTVALVELCAERERIVGKPVVEGMIQPDGTMSITFIGGRLFGRREKRREREGGGGGGGCLTFDGALLHLNSDRQRETMDDLVAIGAVVPHESMPLIALRDATYAIGQVFHGKGMIEEFCVSYSCGASHCGSCGVCCVRADGGACSADSSADSSASAGEGGCADVALCVCFFAELGRQEKGWGKWIYGESGAVARGKAMERLNFVGNGHEKSAREKGDLAKAGLNDRSRIGVAVPLKVPFGQLQIS
ncbi:uncharacterized protein MONOS_8214 [Monocercomonoides exilis]|uniref:uncharacterized protein n=1 Tax=Monocercomonoides exilis TaxID=2049356 RepID=UPI00355A23F3|nr:hypothetical protein MONOS_8214 [Monocercomonoides exilis]|eukprot:MONOS_8214.1-p1 / transcript=MONOS_8214.1 / gene=MONOS_8214 / organism=Monocercomonoides_exilis_PA203 / gene_product=unspecified product / transcript_product=unspecified product / location=Mono_scaffold00303:57816-59061(+) / protein_length=248 / sequence_SO=supercontig / SO=protein_coding / is_pseudo=false